MLGDSPVIDVFLTWTDLLDCRDVEEAEDSRLKM